MVELANPFVFEREDVKENQFFGGVVEKVEDHGNEGKGRKLVVKFAANTLFPFIRQEVVSKRFVKQLIEFWAACEDEIEVSVDLDIMHFANFVSFKLMPEDVKFLLKIFQASTKTRSLALKSICLDYEVANVSPFASQLFSLDNLVYLKLSRKCRILPEAYITLMKVLSRNENLIQVDICSPRIDADNFNPRMSLRLFDPIYMTAPKFLIRKKIIKKLELSFIDLDEQTFYQSQQFVNRNEKNLLKGLNYQHYLVKLKLTGFDLAEDITGISYITGILLALKDSLRELELFRTCFNTESFDIFVWVFLKSQELCPEMKLETLGLTNTANFVSGPKKPGIKRILAMNRLLRQIILTVVNIGVILEDAVLQELNAVAATNGIWRDVVIQTTNRVNVEY